ncbi:MAG: S8 family serine peptidase, partial [Anaerolineales bacterium]
EVVEVAAEDAIEPGPEIHLNAGTFDPLAESGLKLAGLETLSAVEEEAATTYLLQFTGPVREAWKTRVAELGARLYTYVPDYAFIARLDPAQIEAVRDLPFVRWVGVYQPAYRLAETFRVAAAATSGAMEMTALDDPLEITVQALPDADLDALAAQIAAWGGKSTMRAQRMTAGVLRVTISPDNVVDIASLDDVLWVEPYLPPALLNDVGGGEIMRATDVRADLGLYGEGQIVGVADSGLDVGTTGSEMSDDFEGRIAHAEATCQHFGMRTTWHDFDGHGTHVAGSVLGNGVNSGSNPGAHQYDSSFAGVAPEAQLVFQAVDDNASNPNLECIPTDLDYYIFRIAYQEGARIHTNSWGGPTGGTSGSPEYGGYNESSQAADDAAWNRKDLLILFAAGNSGVDANADGLVDPDSIGSPGTAKNVLTVGATESLRNTTATWGGAWPEDYPVDPIFSDYIADNQDGMAAFSSRGPTDDGRIKPEVAAPGTMIISARSHDPDAGEGWGIYDDDYLYMGGTSMATPLTAGGAAVVREWLVKQGGVSNPSAALLKAMLINGAADMSPGQYASPQEIPAQRPNTVAGWGRVDLLETVSPTGNRSLWYRDATSGLATGATEEYPLTLAAGETLRVTLAWTDYPGSPWVNRQLVNDLDLEVIGPDSTSYYGNSGAYATGHGCLRNDQWDQCNNVESVIIPSAAAGSYTVRVHAQNVPNGPQPFALAASANLGTSNAAPTLSGLPDQILNAGQTLDNAIDLHNYADDAEDDVADLTFSVISALPTGLNVQIDGNRYVDITATVGFAGAAAVEIQVEDTDGLTASDAFTVTVNSEPTLAGLPNQVAPQSGWEQAIDLWEYAVDTEDDVADLTFSIISQTVNLATISNNRYIDINPPSGYTGTAQVQVQVADTGGLTATDTFAVEVTEDNLPPELALEDVTLEMGQAQSIDLWPYTTDRDHAKETLTFTVESVSDANLTAVITDPGAHYLYLSPAAGWTGAAQVTLQVEDPAGATVTDTLNVTVESTGGLIYLPLVTKNWPPLPLAPTLNAITPNPSTDGSYTVN